MPTIIILLYRPVRSTADLIFLQEDTTSLGLWANSVSLHFNPRNARPWFYLGGNILQSLAFEWSTCWFCGQYQLTISADLSWSKHIKNITSKARQLVGLLSSSSTNMLAPILSANFILQLCGHIWSMLVKFGTPTWLKIVRWLRVFQSLQVGCAYVDWSRNTKYQRMLEYLNMPSLAACRRQRKLCTLYMIVDNLSEYPSPLLIPKHPYYPSCSVYCSSFVRLCTY